MDQALAAPHAVVWPWPALKGNRDGPVWALPHEANCARNHTAAEGFESIGPGLGFLVIFCLCHSPLGTPTAGHLVLQ